MDSHWQDISEESIIEIVPSARRWHGMDNKNNTIGKTLTIKIILLAGHNHMKGYHWQDNGDE